MNRLNASPVDSRFLARSYAIYAIAAAVAATCLALTLDWIPTIRSSAAVPRTIAHLIVLAALCAAVWLSRRARDASLIEPTSHAFGPPQETRKWLDAIPFDIWTATPQAKQTFLSASMVTYSGRTMAQWNESYTDLLHPEEVSRVLAAWTQATALGEPYRIEHRIRGAGGNYRWFQVCANPLRDQNGHITHWVGSTADIHELKQTEAALRETAQRLQTLVDAIPIEVWWGNSEGKLAYCNRQILEFFGLKYADGRDFDVTKLIHPDDLEEANKYPSLMATGAPWAHKLRHRRADGVYRRREVRVQPHRSESGELTGWYGVNIDIEDAERLQGEVRELQRQLVRASQVATVAELSASIAHEVNQPLTAVVSGSDACQRWLSLDPPNIDRARVSADRIARDANEAAEIIHRIRSLFKRATPALGALGVNEVITEVLSVLRHSVQREAVKVELQLAEGLPRMLADRVQIQQVISNLVQNAVDAMNEVRDRERRLILRSRLAERALVAVEVCDNGPGLKHPDRIFESFFTTKSAGMGMGLAICRSIVEAHGGRIWATPNADRGTTFSFSLPAQENLTA